MEDNEIKKLSKEVNAVNVKVVAKRQKLQGLMTKEVNEFKADLLALMEAFVEKTGQVIYKIEIDEEDGDVEFIEVYTT